MPAQSTDDEVDVSTSTTSVSAVTTRKSTSARSVSSSSSGRSKRPQRRVSTTSSSTSITTRTNSTSSSSTDQPSSALASASTASESSNDAPGDSKSETVDDSYDIDTYSGVDPDILIEQHNEQWLDVSDDDIPTMTYNAYIELAHSLLDKETVNFMKHTRLAPSNGWHGNFDEWKNWQPGTIHPSNRLLRVQKRYNRHMGRTDHRVIAADDLAHCQIIAFVGGKLMFAADANEEAYSAATHLMLDASWMKSHWGYKGKGLMLSQLHHKSIVSYIRDPSEYDPKEEEKRRQQQAQNNASSSATSSSSSAAADAQTDSDDDTENASDYENEADNDGEAIGSEDGNCNLDLLFDREQGVVFVIVYTSCKILRGQEVFLHFNMLMDFPDTAISREHAQLCLRARVNHFNHKFITELEKTLRKAGKEWDPVAEKKYFKSVIPLSAQQEFEHWGEHADRVNAYNANALMAGSFAKVDLPEVYTYSNCREMQVSYYSGYPEEDDPEIIDAELRQHLKSMANYLPEFVEVPLAHTYDKDKRIYRRNVRHYGHRYQRALNIIQNHWAVQGVQRAREEKEFIEKHSLHKNSQQLRQQAVPLPDISNAGAAHSGEQSAADWLGPWTSHRDIPLERIPFDSAALYHMIGRNPDGRLKKNVNELQKVRSFNHELVEVREILNVTNPVRHLCVPQKSCYAIVAKKQIERGAILWSYAGQLEKAVPGQAKTTSYVYGVPASKLKAITGGKYAGPDLQIDAESAGNIARFANDTRFRVREREDRGFNVNAKAVDAAIVDGMPLVILYAWKDISAGSEVIIDYGDDYWTETVRTMLKDHKKYYDWSYRYKEYLLAQCSIYKLPLPRKPSTCNESYGLFEKKIKPYPINMLPPAELIDWDVDYISEKYIDADGYARFEYYWKGWLYPEYAYADDWEQREELEICIQRYYEKRPEHRHMKGSKIYVPSDSESEDEEDGANENQNENSNRSGKKAGSNKNYMSQESLYAAELLASKPTKPTASMAGKQRGKQTSSKRRKSKTNTNTDATAAATKKQKSTQSTSSSSSASASSSSTSASSNGTTTSSSAATSHPHSASSAKQHAIPAITLASMASAHKASPLLTSQSLSLTPSSSFDSLASSASSASAATSVDIPLEVSDNAMDSDAYSDVSASASHPILVE